jgi:hypothetical protein
MSTRAHFRLIQMPCCGQKLLASIAALMATSVADARVRIRVTIKPQISTKPAPPPPSPPPEGWNIDPWARYFPDPWEKYLPKDEAIRMLKEKYK